MTDDTLYSGLVMPDTNPELFSAILLGDAWSPGVVTLSGHNREENWDIQSAKGSEGSSTKLNGRPVGQFQASFFLADQDDVYAWHEFQRLIESTTSGPSPFALPIFHPDLAANGFTDVTNGGVGGLVWDSQGGATVQVKFLEYRPPAPKPAKKATPKSSSSTARASDENGYGVREKPDPNADAKRELAALVEEAQRP